jgi:glycosyltransferase involved in cell wall biosynthesis
MAQPRVTAVIPTRNRPTLAQVGVRVALQALGPEDELIVADNGDQPLELRIDDPRLTVLRSDRVLNMPDNWERALLAARGEWLVFLSDKCRLVPGAVDALLKLVGERSIISYLKVPFTQEVPPEKLGDPAALRAQNGVASRAARPKGEVAVRDSREALREWYASLYYCPYLPMLYNALVHRRLVDAPLKRYGRFFVGSSPDVGSSLVILGQTRDYIETTLPGVGIHFPTKDLAQWSMGVASFSAHPARQKVLSEFEQSIFADYRLPPIATGGMAHSLLQFKKARPELAAQVEFDWDRFSFVATNEIEGLPLDDKWRLHAQVLQAAQLDRFRPRAVVQQLRALASSRMPHAWRLLRWLSGRQAPPPATTPTEESHASLDAFLAAMSEECRAAAPSRHLKAC